MKRMLISVALTLALSATAMAAEVPTEVTVQNLNGSQEYIQTFTASPDIDLETLKVAPFDHEGYTYTFASVTKLENLISEKKVQTETVTVKTTKKDLSTVLAQLQPTLEYDDGIYQGVLSLDHTSIVTEAAGYAQQSYTVSTTKAYDSLPSNDMSYIPATAVKDGVTLNLAAVDWQVQATALVDDVLVPSLYRAVASYSAAASYNAATGYISAAEYMGTVSRSGVESVTYTLTYLGEETVPVAENTFLDTVQAHPILAVGGGVSLIAIVALAAALLQSRRQVRRLRENETYDDAVDASYEETKEERS